VLLWACLRYQRFHFFPDRGLLAPRERFNFHPAELSILRRLGKEVYFWTYGADVRTRRRTESLGAFHCCTLCPAPGRSCVCDDEAGAANLRRIADAATAVFAMGDMTEYTPGSRNDLFFWPVDLQADGGRRFAPRFPDPQARGPLRIVHAPNHPEFKGTRFLIEAVEELRREGHEIDLQLVQKVPNAQAVEIYRSADLIFDQCLVGFHGYFAIEAMAMGKPVLTYIRKREYLLHPEECPLQSASAGELTERLRELVRDRSRLHELGRAGRRYVEKHFTLEAFAGRMQRAYNEIGAC
jgi:glycosyltransferase involved in cell wall biosynthesis